MARKAVVLTCSEEERKALEKLANSKTAEVRLTNRAKIVLSCISGAMVKDIARENNVGEEVVIDWRERFRKDGINGLKDKPRSGKPKSYDQEFEKSLLSLLETPPPDGMARWDGPTAAKRLNASEDAVWRAMRKFNICLSRQRTWCISTDVNFVAKAADIVGLYLNPPEKAIVIAVDEKPAIQAIERQTGYVMTRDRKTVHGLQSTYKRHGTLNLFAALEVASGQIKGKTTKEKKKVDFLAFMDSVVSSYSQEQELHVIADNHSIHKNLDNWLEKHPNVTFHYTPTSASWLNMVEIWFGILSRKVLKGGSFKDTDDLSNKILQYIAAYSKEAHPFVWRKREVNGAQIKNTLRNLCN